MLSRDQNENLWECIKTHQYLRAMTNQQLLVPLLPPSTDIETQFQKRHNRVRKILGTVTCKKKKTYRDIEDYRAAVLSFFIGSFGREVRGLRV